jgi:hypothetical protein
MTDDSRVIALLKDVLDASPTTAPDRLLTTVLRDVREAPQRGRRPFPRDWRRLVANRSGRLVTVGVVLVAVIGVVAVGQIALRPTTSAPGVSGSSTTSSSEAPSRSPIPTPTPTQAARFGPAYGPLAPGRYTMPEPNTDLAGPWPRGRVTLTVPDGWTQSSATRGGGIVRGTGQGAATAQLVFGRLGSLQPKPDQCAPPLGQPGPSVDDLVSSLRAVADVQVADLTIGPYRGKRVEFAIADPSSDCRPLHGWSTPSGGEQWIYHWDPGWTHQLSILDIDGVRFVIDASYRIDAPPTVAAEVQAIVDSIELE